MPCVIDLRAFEPYCPRHAVDAECAFERSRRLDLVVLPDAAPEGIEIRDRPAPQMVVILERQTKVRLQPLLIAANLRRGTCDRHVFWDRCRANGDRGRWARASPRRHPP